MEPGRRPLAVATATVRRFGTPQDDRLARRFSKGIGPNSAIAQADLLALRNLPEVASHFATPADATYVNENTDCVGFVGASSLERLGVEGPLVELTQRFKKIPAPAAKKRG